MADFVPGYEASQWFVAGLRKTTPVEIMDKLNKEINASIAEPEMKVRIDKLGATPTPRSPADKFITHETEKWAKVTIGQDVSSPLDSCRAGRMPATEEVGLGDSATQ